MVTVRTPHRRLKSAKKTCDWPVVFFLFSLSMVGFTVAIRHFFLEPAPLEVNEMGAVNRQHKLRWKRQMRRAAREEWEAEPKKTTDAPYIRPSTLRRQRTENETTHAQTSTPRPATAKPVARPRKKRAVVKEPSWAGRWERSQASALTSCRKLVTAPSMARWQQVCQPKPWTRNFRYGPLDCTFLGTDYGGFYLPNRLCFLHEQPEPPNRSYVAYGFGIGSDVSYDIALAAAFPNLVVRMFDPTPTAVTHAEHVLAAVDSGAAPCHMGISAAACTGSYFEAMAHSRVPSKQLSVHPWALGTSDGFLSFGRTTTGSLFTEKNQGGGGPADGYAAIPSPPPAPATGGGGAALQLPVRTLSSIMITLGDEVVDILKLDIEGAEVDVLPHLLNLWRGWPKARWPKVLLIDMDAARAGHPMRNITAADATVELLLDAGYMLFAHPKRADYSFVLPLTQREMYYGESQPPPPPPGSLVWTRGAWRRGASQESWHAA